MVFVTATDGTLADESQRVRLGLRARRDVLLRWSPHIQGRAYLGILERAAEAAAERGPPIRRVGRRVASVVREDGWTGLRVKVMRTARRGLRINTPTVGRSRSTR